MVKKALIFCFVALVCVNPARSDVVAGNCNGLSQEILKKYAEFEESIAMHSGKLTDPQAEEVDKLVGLACSPDFEKCGFNICKNPAVANPIPNERPTSAPTESSLPLSTEEGSPPLAWVTESMSCEAFLSQLRTRFQSSSLDESKRKELKMALELACGPKFKHCSFEACQKQVPLE